MATNHNARSLYNSITFENQLSLRVDEGVGAMTISPSGRDVALASRSGLFIIDLDDPFSPPRWLHHVTTWEVADVQWSPHASKPYSVVSTSNQKAIVWNLSLPANRAIEHVLHGHQRAITDVNFHALEPEVLATCSIDSFVHVWDLRVPKRPTTTFADWYAGASQVKWNRTNPHILASSHDMRVYVWDDRMGSCPLRILKGHGSKVNGIDFSRLHETEVLTCSNDFTIKLWDYNKSDPLCTIKANFPVWRARHSPFGNGCVIMPLRGGNNNVYLHKLKDLQGDVQLDPEHVFTGHVAPVREFVWRARGGAGELEDREFQLVTWSKDHDLRLWPLSRPILERVNYQHGSPIGMKMTRRGALYQTYRHEPLGYRSARSNLKRQSFMTGHTSAYRADASDKNLHLQWMAGVRIGRSALTAPFDSSMYSDAELYDENSPSNLGEELSIVGHKFPRTRFEKISVSTGKCIISLNGPWGPNDSDLVFMRIMIDFPLDYPFSTPQFTLEGDADFMVSKAAELTAGLNKIAHKFCSHGKYCLEICLRYLLGDKIDLADYKFDNDLARGMGRLDEAMEDHDLEFGPDHVSMDDDDSSSSEEGVAPPLESSGPFQPAFDSTPIPKGCGATWSKSGFLVCFFEIRKERSQINVVPGARVASKGYREFGTPQLDPPKELDDSESDSDFDDMPFADYSRFGRIRPNYLLNRLKSSRGPGSITDRSHDTRTNPDNKNFVRVVDLKFLIPSRKELATEYLVLGKSPRELAKHNAEVAAKYDCDGIAECWRLLESILSLNVHIRPAQAMDRFPQLLSASGRFEWASHPFGNMWLINELFSYFERQKNTQMLAVMSCVLSGTMDNDNSDSMMHSITPYSEPSLLQTKSPFHPDILPRDPSTGYFGPFASWIQGPAEKPNLEDYRNHLITSRPSSKDDSSVLSLSPEKFLSTKKVVAGMFSKGPYGQSYFGSSRETPGPAAVSRNQSKPQLALTKAVKSAPNLENDFNLGLMYSFSGGSNTRLSSRASLYESSSSNTESMPLPKVQIDVVNEDLLGLSENVPADVVREPTELLDPKRKDRYMIYRSQYATILYSWGLEIESLEILKFNFINPNAKETKRLPSPFDKFHSAQIEFHLRKKVDDPEIIRMRDPVSNRSYSKICQYCRLMVKTRFLQCFHCEHILHDECAKDWWDNGHHTECPSGCGCSCLEYMNPVPA